MITTETETDYAFIGISRNIATLRICILGLVPCLFLFTSCDNAKTSNHATNPKGDKTKEAITLTELASALKPGISMYEAISKLGRPKSELRESNEVRELEYVREVETVPVQGTEHVIGFRAKFTNDRLTRWTLLVIDSESGTNNLYLMDPPPASGKKVLVATLQEPPPAPTNETPLAAPARAPSISSAKEPALEGNNVPLEIFVLPKGLKGSRDVLEPKIRQLNVTLVITAARTYTVRDAKGTVSLAVELSPAELDRFSSFVEQKLGETVVFAINGIPISRAQFGEPMNYFKFDLPLNIK